MKNLIALVCTPGYRMQLGFSFIPQRNEKSNNQFLSILIAAENDENWQIYLTKVTVNLSHAMSKPAFGVLRQPKSLNSLLS